MCSNTCAEVFNADAYHVYIIHRSICFGIRFCVRDLLYHFHSLDHTTKHSVLVIQPWLDDRKQKKTGYITKMQEN